MSAERIALIDEIYRQASAHPPEGRADFLDQTCSEDSDLRRQIEARLAELPTVTMSTAPSGPPQIGPFLMLQRLGEGGMGEVWLVEQTHPIRRRAALKLIKAGVSGKDVAARFESERQALALLDHPNIARVFEAGSTPDGRPYYLMEHVPGVSLTAYCRKHNLGVHERLQLVVAVCKGVQHAHSQAIIHRDLKPSNILVTLRDGVAIPKIIDFGLAKTLSGPLTDQSLHTRLGALLGTPEYMSPEQANVTEQGIDARTDVYSIGVILYELLTGAKPFSPDELYRNGYESARRIILDVDPPAPSSKVKELKGDLERIILKAMHKDRQRRYPSAAELAEDIERHLAGQPVHARPSTITYVAGKFVKRNQTRLLAGALAAALVLVVGLALRNRAPVVSEVHSIALLPLSGAGTTTAGLTSDLADSLAAGLAEELLDVLSQGGWRVISATAAGRVKDETDPRRIGNRLNAELVLEGTLRRVENRVRIQLRILRTATGELVWARSFERPEAQTLGLEREIVPAIAAKLGIAPAQRTAASEQSRTACSAPDAQKAYFEGDREMRQGNGPAFERAALLFERALQQAPLCAELWEGLASARQAQADWGGTSAQFEAAAKAANRALELDPSRARAHALLGSMKLSNGWDWTGAEADLRRASELAPNDTGVLFMLAKIVKAQNRLAEALELHRKIETLDPLFTTNLRQLGMMLHYMGRHHEAMAYFRKTEALNPQEGGLHAMMSRALLAVGDPAGALEEAGRELPNSIAGEVFGGYTRSMALWALGRKTESDAALDKIITKYAKEAPYNVAEAYAFRGDKERMFAWLNRAIVERDSALGLELKCDPLFAPYRIDTRFAEILRQMNLAA